MVVAGEGEDYVGIHSTGVYKPKKVVTADTLASWTGRPVSYYTEWMGMREFRQASEAEIPSLMGIRAAEEAIRKGGIDPATIDLVIYAYSVDKDFHAWQANSKIIHKIGATRAYGLDIENTCNGPLSGLKIAEAWLRTEPTMRTALIVTAETFRGLIDFKDRATSAFNVLGDGASAAIVTKGCARSRLLATHFITRSEFWDLIYIPAGGAAIPASEKTLRKGQHTLHVQKSLKAFRQLSNFGAFRMERFLEATRVVLEKTGRSQKEIGFLVKTQSNRTELYEVLERVGLGPKQTIEIMTHFGHMGPVDILFGLDQALEQQMVKPGTLVLMLSVGGGYHFGAALLEWVGP